MNLSVRRSIRIAEQRGTASDCNAQGKGKLSSRYRGLDGENEEANELGSVIPSA